jgi:hypothetical protein
MARIRVLDLDKPNGSSTPQQTPSNEERWEAIAAEMERQWQELWLKENPDKTARDYRRLPADKLLRWRAAKGKAENAAEAAEWERDHPGQKFPEHECGLTEQEHTDLERWRRNRDAAMLAANGSSSPPKTTGKAQPTKGGRKPAKPKPAESAKREAAVNDEEYVRWVEEGKQIVKQMNADKEAHEDRKMLLGKLADGVAKKYTENRLGRFAKAIGMAECTLKRCRSVYRAWYGADAPKGATPPKSYSVAQELQSHPDRFAIIERRPNLTVREARRITRRDKKEQMSVPDWLRKETRRWDSDVVKHAGLMLRDASVTDGEILPELQQIWREEIDPEILPALREACEAGLKLADYMEKVLQKPPTKEPKEPRTAAAA